jgi:hypothetical protein
MIVPSGELKPANRDVEIRGPSQAGHPMTSSPNDRIARSPDVAVTFVTCRE